MPTFGDTSAGADSFPTTPDRALLSRFELTEAGEIINVIMLYLAGTAGMSMKGLIYSDVSGTPTTRLAVGSAEAVPGAGGWVTSTLSYSAAPGFYWIGAVNDDSNCAISADASPGNGSRMEDTTYASPAATWVNAGTTSTQMNVYATYTVAQDLDQEGHRWRYDDGNETTATWKAAQDANISLAIDVPVRLRVLVNATGDPATAQYRLEYRRGSLPWKVVN